MTWNLKGRANNKSFRAIFVVVAVAVVVVLFFFMHSFSTWHDQAVFFKFQSIYTLTTKVTDDSKQFQCSKIVFGDKTKPLFVGLH